MKENKKRKDYLQPDVAILSIDEESHLLVQSPLVRPGQGGSGSQTQGSITVEPPTSDDENPDDNIEG
jgi:hypothetical protein